MFLWTSPHGYHHLVDHDGTTDIDADRSRHGRCAPHSTNEQCDTTNEQRDSATERER